jgi:hypothetical protein
MSASSEASEVTLFNDLTIQMNRYFGIFIFFIGTIGNIFNILVLSKKELRSNPCAWLFLMSSIMSISTFFSGLTTRILSGWQLDYSTTNRFLCKLRGLVAFGSLNATFWLIALATIDRWLSSSILTSRRQKSTLKNAQRGTIFIISLSFGLYIQMLVCYEANLINTPTKCYSKSSACLLLNNLSLALISILCPLLIMILFGLMTISNIRQSHLRIHHQPTNASGQPTNTTGQQNQRKKIDRQLLIMLFFQITVFLILSLPLPIDRFYLTFTSNNYITTLQTSIDSFIYNLALLAIYLANGIPFYIYTICGGSIFRKALFDVFTRFRRMIFCQ